jgi:hypothetical protein
MALVRTQVPVQLAPSTVRHGKRHAQGRHELGAQRRPSPVDYSLDLLSDCAQWWASRVGLVRKGEWPPVITCDRIPSRSAGLDEWLGTTIVSSCNRRSASAQPAISQTELARPGASGIVVAASRHIRLPVTDRRVAAVDLTSYRLGVVDASHSRVITWMLGGNHTMAVREQLRGERHRAPASVHPAVNKNERRHDQLLPNDDPCIWRSDVAAPSRLPRVNVTGMRSQPLTVPIRL